MWCRADVEDEEAMSAATAREQCRQSVLDAGCEQWLHCRLNCGAEGTAMALQKMLWTLMKIRFR